MVSCIIHATVASSLCFWQDCYWYCPHKPLAFSYSDCSLPCDWSTASLWGVISFSISGMSFPVMAMNPVLQGLAYLFPLRHYFLIYVNLALNGYPLIYAWHSVVALMLFMLLPFFILKRLRTVLLHYVYIP